MNSDSLLQLPPFGLDQTTKEGVLFPAVQQLHRFHLAHSPAYNRICEVLFPGHSNVVSLADLPFIPVSAFKQHTLRSIPEADVFKVLTSSGTTGNAVSRIYLDRETSRRQTVALSKILGELLGPSRLPMLIVDSKAVLADRTQFSARGAGILGLSVFGRDHTYLLDDAFRPQEGVLEAFLEKYSGQRMLIFGFTFMVWQYLAQASLQGRFSMKNAVLLHSGGWKKLQSIAVNNDVFKQVLHDRFGLNHVINFYGMAEQVGSIFPENEDGNLQCPAFAEVIVRDPYNLSPLPPGQEGLIQVISALPASYPGHSLLTEDLGILVRETPTSSGWHGRQFRITGRARKAELRGCSDTFKPTEVPK